MIDHYKKSNRQGNRISVIGLGYVGLPLAIELSKKYEVVGFDLNSNKLEKYKSGIDVTGEVGEEALKKTDVIFTDEENQLKSCNFHIVSVPTPINIDKTPNLDPIIKASEMVGKNLVKGSIVVYESTVYPGTTEEICVPILEKSSGLIFGKDFKIGYSPERINPGDKVNTLTKIIKVVSGSDEEALNVISGIYESIIEAGVFRAESIKVAEAAKVIENTQRDINIAFMNELSMVFNKMNINTDSVLKAASTKWNFLNFSPGLVGGHCIGVDPYYFIYKAEQLGFHSQLITAGRKINDGMGKHVATNIVKKLIQAESRVKGAKVALFGLTFKENVPDVRNSKVIDIIEELKEYEIDILVHDPIADPDEVKMEYNINLVKKKEIQEADAVIIAVPHKLFNEYFDEGYFEKILSKEKPFIDIKGAVDREKIKKIWPGYWSL